MASSARNEPRPTAVLAARRLAIVVLLIAADLWSKSAVVGWLEASPAPAGTSYDAHGHHRYEVFGEWFAFMVSYNHGMAWGFDKLPPWLLVGGRCVAVGFLIWLVVRATPAKRVLNGALMLILAGAAGNLHDNLVLEPRRADARFGPVRDFIDVYFGFADWHFPTFNVADACITVGAILLLLSSFTAEARAEASEPAHAA